MNISKMTDQEKSLALAKLCGWVKQEGIAWAFHPSGLGNYYSHLATLLNYKPEHITPNLYDPANMALAWLVLNWAMEQTEPMVIRTSRWAPEPFPVDFGSEVDYWLSEKVDIARKPPAEAQRAWLDEIVELAIEAGLVKEPTP